MSSERDKLFGYVGIPFVKDGRDRNGVDCLGLVIMAYREIWEIKLFDLKGAYVPGARSKGKDVFREHYHHNWKKLRRDNKRPFDLVFFRDCDGATRHVGIIVNRWEFIHCLKTSGVVISRINDDEWKEKIEGFYRYKYAGYTEILSNKI